MDGFVDLSVAVSEEEITVPPDATPLEYLRAVYTNSRQPEHRRLRAAIECLPFVHPKLMVSAFFDGKSFAAQLEKAIARTGKSINGPGTLIEHEATKPDEG